MSPNSVNILGVSINSTSKLLVLRQITEFEPNRAPLLVFTPNPEFLVEADKDKNFKELLNRSDINLPDGVGIVWAGKLFGTPIKERVSGADVVRELLEDGNRQGKWTIGIVGARRAVLEESVELVKRLQQKYPNITFINLDSPKFQITSRFAANYKFQIVLACYGMKKQEEWIMENKNRVNSSVFMGIGGSLDFITGFSKRAPLLIRRIGLEWLWRGLQRPSHFKRVWKATVVFGFLVLKEKIKRFL